MKVENIKNNNGNSVKNQFIIIDEVAGETTFQSYESTICKIITKHTCGFDALLKIYPDWNYSKTTLKYFYKFLSDYNIPLKNKDEVAYALECGHCRLDEGIAVLDGAIY